MKEGGVEHVQLDETALLETLDSWEPLHVAFFTLSNGAYQMLFFKGG